MSLGLIIFISIAACYLLGCILFIILQEKFIFQAEVLPSNFQFQYEFPFEEVFIDTEPGAMVNGLLFTVPNSKGVVFYFKGNTRSIKGWAKYSKDFLSKGYDFFLIDYRGFGKSRGKRTEDALNHDCQMAYKWLSKRYAEEDIVIYGRSLGSGFAAKIAAWNEPKMMILDCPYYSFLNTVRRFMPFFPVKWLLRYHMRTDKWVPSIKCPIFILHGSKDGIIPFRSGAKLVKLNPERSKIYPIAGAHHNNLPDFAGYHNRLYEILNGLQTEKWEDQY